MKVSENSPVNGIRSTRTLDGSEHILEETHIGRVLSLREANGYHDSDFYATVWLDAENAPKEIQYATTRGWTYLNCASVDATEEIKAKYETHMEAVRLARVAKYEAELAKCPKIGDSIKVISGRKIPVGTQARVFWVGEDSYTKARRSKYDTGARALLGFYYHSDEWRVGVEFEGKRVFTNAKNIEITSRETK